MLLTLIFKHGTIKRKNTMTFKIFQNRYATDNRKIGAHAWLIIFLIGTIFSLYGLVTHGKDPGMSLLMALNFFGCLGMSTLCFGVILGDDMSGKLAIKSALIILSIFAVLLLKTL